MDAAALVAAGADLADQHKSFWIGMKSRTDELVDDVRPVVLGRVDVVDAGVDGLSEEEDRVVVVGGWPEDARPGQAHRAVADRTYPERAESAPGVGRREWEPRRRSAAHRSALVRDVGHVRWSMM